MTPNDLGKTPSLKQLVYNNLRSRIISGELSPGCRLLESDLSKEMDISRAPVREALNMLERDGLATMIPRRGAIVTVFTKEDVEYIWNTRILLEPTAGKMATQRVSEEDLNRVEELLMRVQANPDDMSLYTDSDLELHDLLYCNIDNHYIRDFLLNLKAHSLCVRWTGERQMHNAPIAAHPVVLKATQEHLEILNALRSRDGDAVFRAVEKHLKDSMKRTVIGNN